MTCDLCAGPLLLPTQLAPPSWFVVRVSQATLVDDAPHVFGDHAALFLTTLNICRNCFLDSGALARVYVERGEERA